MGKDLTTGLAKSLKHTFTLDAFQTRSSAEAAVASVELMPSYRRIMPALELQELTKHFTRYSLVSLIVSGTELPDRENLRIKVSCG